MSITTIHDLTSRFGPRSTAILFSADGPAHRCPDGLAYTPCGHSYAGGRRTTVLACLVYKIPLCAPCFPIGTPRRSDGP